MISKLFLMALLTVAVSSSPISSGDASNVNFGEAMGMFLQAFKKIMPCGYAPDNIPVLAPLTSDFTSFDYSSGNDFKIVGNASNIRIDGLNNYQIISGSYDVNTQHATYDVIFPEIQAFGAYEVEGFVNIAGYRLPIRENSLLNEKLIDVRFVGSYTLAQSQINPLGLSIENYEVEIYVAGVKINNWNKLWSPSINNMVNSWSDSILTSLFEQMQTKWSSIYNLLVVPQYNELLLDVSMPQVIGFLVNSAQAWNEAGCSAQ